MENTVLTDALLKEREALIERIKAIDVILSPYGYDFENKLDNAKKSAKKALDIIGEPKNFPINGRKDKQVLWLFNNHFDKGIKLNELQSKYNELKGLDDKGEEIRVDNTARRLKRESKLAVVKYNKSNKNAFWGLPEWIENDDFNDEYRPDKNKLPIDIESTDVSMGN
jgi:hypothetical protein